jgi:hypothetical protein
MIGVFTVGYVNHTNNKLMIFDLADDAIITHSVTPKMSSISCEGLSKRSWIRTPL